MALAPSVLPFQAVVYISACTRPMTPGRLEALQAEASRLNRDSGVTGALLHSDGLFMQYFEGEPDAVVATYDRIRRSRQHTRIVEMMNEPIARRAFPDWHMALAEPAASEVLRLSTADWVVHNSRTAAAGQGSVGMAMLRDFWRRRGRSP